ncbi:MAG: hypothetical protein V1720_17825 [bacterium]
MRKIGIIIFLLITIFSIEVAAQITVPIDQRGNRKYRKEGIHNGNLVETIFYNFGEVAWWGREPSGVWPKGSGHTYMDGITPLVIAEVVDANGNTIHMAEAGYRENMDVAPDGTERGWQPRPGYTNPNQDNIAMSDNPITWPGSWPGKDESWNGYWDGYFGKRTNADQESYFVMDDNCDDAQEFYPDATDETRRGLGLSVAVRGFQWSNVLSEDLIFWHYEITDEGTYDFNKIIFGMYVDCGVGGQMDSNDDYASFEKSTNITYSFDHDGIGDGGWSPTGYAGYAFLESPGNPFNKADDDYDGEEGSPTVTESMLVGEIPGNGIDDNANGLVDEAELNIGMKYADGEDNDGDGLNDEMIDESRDDGIDNNSNWDVATDDVGLDGLAGSGDFGEGDGKPTSGWQPVGVVPGAPESPVNRFGLVNTGQPGEPRIDKTDINESDQIGLTAFDVFYIGSGILFYNDDRVWERISYSHFDTRLQNGNIAFLFGSGPFILPSGTTERFSLGLLFGNDLNDILRNKQVVQQIYDNNYNFARPPDKPKVSVVTGDGQVTLYWDNEAEYSFDSFLKRYDFEGYRIYRSTDPAFIDAYQISSGYGDATLYKPSAQFDIVNDVKGFFDLDYQGVKYYMGDNKGLQHSWTDTDVINGQTYFYAVAAYDRGDASIGLYPSECNKVITRDLAGNIFTDVNTVYATPGTAVAGYVAPAFPDSVMHLSGYASGQVVPVVINPYEVKDKKYLLSFAQSDDDTTLYSLREITGNDTISIFENSSYVSGEDSNPLFDGIKLAVINDEVDFDFDRSGWKNNSSNLVITASKTQNTPTINPSSFEIRVGERDSSWSPFVFMRETDFLVWDIQNSKKVRFQLAEQGTPDGMISDNEELKIYDRINNSWKEIWRLKFTVKADEVPILPSQDIGQIFIKTPFRYDDVYTFTTQAHKVDEVAAKEGLDDIAVVPNPYVGTARWEPQRLTRTGRADRRIYFIHLPQEATIRIYTISGDHVITLEHNSNLLDGKLSWDLTNKGGLAIAPGVYIFHVDAPGLGEKIGRFAILK